MAQETPARLTASPASSLKRKVAARPVIEPEQALNCRAAATIAGVISRRWLSTVYRIANAFDDPRDFFPWFADPSAAQDYLSSLQAA